ncbi:MAG: macro domain-containing protein [bacterium]
MIDFISKGDLIKNAKKVEYNGIIHGCNCFCTMGAGIAKQIRNEFPSAYLADQKTENGSKEKLGDYSLANVFVNEDYDFYVINAYTQYDYKGKNNVDYNAIRNVFKKINNDFKGMFFGIPKIGAGLAGGDWDVISKIIDEVTPDISLELVEYNGG